MPKPEWGVKRTCPHCETRFYDLQKEPIVCPECGTTYDVDAHGKVSHTRERKAPVPAEVDEDLVDEEDVVKKEDTDEDEDGALLGDEEEDEGAAKGPTLSDEEDEEDGATFKDPALIDADEDEDEDDLDEDDDNEDLDLDTIPDKNKQ